MRKSLFAFVALMLIQFSARDAFSQTKPYNEEITVIAAFDPIIPDAFKVNVNPAITDTTTTVPAMTYSFVPRDARVQLDIEQLPAVKLVAEPLAKLYRNYVKAGFGNYTTLYGELYASSLRSKTNLLGIHLKHFSADGKIKDYGPTTNSTQFAELYGQRYFNQHSLSANLFVNRDGLRLYGYHPDDTALSNIPLKQRYLVTGGEVMLGSRYKSDEKLEHTAGISFYHLSDKFEVKENHFRLQGSLSKSVDLFKWDTKQKAGLSAYYDFYNQADSTNKINAGILNLTPTLTATIDEYSFKAGLGFNVGIDTITKAHLYPMLEARIELVPGGLQLYAGFDGGMERNSIRTLIETNPYITSGLPLQYTYNKFRAYGGINSNISRTFNFNASISSTTFENYPFFVTDSNAALRNSFTLLNDDISQVRLKAELEFIKSDKLRIGVSGSYYSYKLDNEPFAWYKPDFDLGLNVSYHFQEKINLKFQTTYNGPVKAPILPLDSKKQYSVYDIPGWVDINLGAEYRLKKALSFWLNINNISNNQHLYWYNYPSYGLNLLLGVSYSF